MQDDDINALIGQMFALLTARLEDGAGLAIEGQVPTRRNYLHSLVTSELSPATPWR